MHNFFHLTSKFCAHTTYILCVITTLLYFDDANV
nr:MAG TPA: hypothetical protein [Caudoviricetes sp.]